jgi:hypothetical protein
MLEESGRTLQLAVEITGSRSGPFWLTAGSLMPADLMVRFGNTKISAFFGAGAFLSGD